MNELYHHGIKGQEWGVRNGPPYPLKDSKVLTKNTELTRYSSKKEDKLSDSVYASHTKRDSDWYKNDYALGKLGIKNPEKNFYKIKISTVDDITIKTAKSVVDDILKKTKDTTLASNIKEFSKLGYYDNKTAEERSDIIGNDYTRLNELRKNTAKKIHSFIQDHGKDLLSEYRKAGYDAIVDPEDYTYIYDEPLILLNKNKFRISGYEKYATKKVLKSLQHSLNK